MRIAIRSHSEHKSSMEYRIRLIQSDKAGSRACQAAQWQAIYAKTHCETGCAAIAKTRAV